MFALLRIAIGLILLISGLEKLISPYQNFLYAIQAYAALPGWAENLTARVMPWLEFLIGLFLTLGLWSNGALKGALMLFAVFIVVVGQALLRGLPIDQCGCFGASIHIPPKVIIVIDSAVLLLTALLLRNLKKTRAFSLDQAFDQ